MVDCDNRIVGASLRETVALTSSAARISVFVTTGETVILLSKKEK